MQLTKARIPFYTSRKPNYLRECFPKKNFSLISVMCFYFFFFFSFLSWLITKVDLFTFFLAQFSSSHQALTIFLCFLFQLVFLEIDVDFPLSLSFPVVSLLFFSFLRFFILSWESNLWSKCKKSFFSFSI